VRKADRSATMVHDVEAHNLVNRAIERGVLKRKDACEACGSKGNERRDGGSGIEAHHDNYNFPLRVRFLCKRCHRTWHVHNKAVPRDPNADPLDTLLDSTGSEVDFGDALLGEDPLDALLAE